MKKQEYEAKCKELFAKAEKFGVKLEFDPSTFDEWRVPEGVECKIKQ